ANAPMPIPVPHQPQLCMSESARPRSILPLNHPERLRAEISGGYLVFLIRRSNWSARFQRKRWRAASGLVNAESSAGVHIMTRETVDADLLDAAFFHAWLAGDESWVNVLVQHVIATSDEDRTKLASLMPMFREAQADPAFLTGRPYVKLLLRLAQHLLKSAIGSDADVARSARGLIERLDAMSEDDQE